MSRSDLDRNRQKRRVSQGRRERTKFSPTPPALSEASRIVDFLLFVNFLTTTSRALWDMLPSSRT